MVITGLTRKSTEHSCGCGFKSNKDIHCYQCAYPQNDTMFVKNKQYLYTLFSLLRNTFRGVGAGDVLTEGINGYGLVISGIYIDKNEDERLDYLPVINWTRLAAQLACGRGLDKMYIIELRICGAESAWLSKTAFRDPPCAAL